MSSNGDIKFLTHEVGSLAKPPWLVKTSAGKPLDEGDVEHAQIWGEKLEVDGHEGLVELLRQDERDPDEIARWSSRYCLRLQESAGVDVIWDGEQQRSEMYAWAVAHANGFEWRGSVRAFDNKYYSKAAVTGPISLREPYHNAEFAFLRSVARAPLKVPVTGAYTIADWSFDEYFIRDHDLALPAVDRRKQRHEARRTLVLELARNLIRPNLQAQSVVARPLSDLLPLRVVE